MDPAEHCKEAENLLAMAMEGRLAIQAGDPTAGPADEPALLVARAQVHATLAMAGELSAFFAIVADALEAAS